VISKIRMRNASDDIHPVHLHRLVLGSLASQESRRAGILKEVVMLGSYQGTEIDFVADDPGLTLFHRHQIGNSGLKAKVGSAVNYVRVADYKREILRRWIVYVANSRCYY